MSDSESFIQEVSDEVRRDTFYANLKKYGWIGAAVVVLLVGGTAWNEWNKANATAEARRVGGELLDALEDADATPETLAAVQTDSPARAVAALLLAAEQVDADDAAGALTTLEALSVDPDVPELYRELGMIKALMLPVEGRDLAEQRAGFEAIAVPGRPFRMIALEQLAMMDAADGNIESAIELYREIAVDAEATRLMSERAAEMIIFLGGDLDPEDAQ